MARSLAVVLVAGLAAVSTGAGTAGAAPALGKFASQARAAGLDSAQAGVLQGRVDAYLRQVGGVQTAANEISVGDGVTLTLTLPGEQRVRDLTSGATGKGVVAAAAPRDCPSLTFCAYRNTDLTGDRIDAYHCYIVYNMPWYGYGSWANNQSQGTLARLEGQNGGVLYYSFAYEQYYDFNWGPIWYIDPC